MLEKVAANNQERSSLLSVQWVYSAMFNVSRTSNIYAQWNDPLVEIQELGQKSMMVGAATAGVSGAASYLGQGAAIAAAFTGNIPGSVAAATAGYVADIISYFGYALLILGIVLAVVLPFLPFVYFLSGAIGWTIMAIEAVIAAPLWILLTFVPHRGGDIIGINKQGLMLLIGVFFRPVLLVLGLIVCFLVMRVGLDLVSIMFTGIYMIVAPSSDVSSMALAVGLLGMYVLTLVALTSNCSVLITGLGDAVMEFIGVQVKALGRNEIGDQLVRKLMPEEWIMRAGDNLASSSLNRTRNMASSAKKGATNFLTRKKGSWQR